MSEGNGNDHVLRVVLDTNVLIDSAQDPFSASAQLLEAIQEGRIEGLATLDTQREYRKIIRRLILDEEEQSKLLAFVDELALVDSGSVEVAIDDAEDYKFLQAAAGGQAHLLVTSDKHLLDVGELGGTRVVRPTEALAALEEEAGGEWTTWVEGLGIK